MLVVFPAQLAAAMLSAVVPALSDVAARPPMVLVQSQQADEAAGNLLAGTEWLLKSLRGTDVDPAIGSSLSFDGEGNASGNGGCNRFRGGVTIEGQTLRFGGLVSTRMACVEEEKTRQEADYHAAMAETAGFRVDQGELSLLNQEDEVVARLTPAQ